MERKILVCITPQSGSERLIDKGLLVASEMQGELHILNVEKGNNILATSSSILLIQKLFDYGSELGGVVHGLAGVDVYETIKGFIKENKITDIVLGTPVKNQKAISPGLNERIGLEMPYLKMHIIEK